MYCFLFIYYDYKLIHFISSVHDHESILIVINRELNELP